MDLSVFIHGLLLPPLYVGFVFWSLLYCLVRSVLSSLQSSCKDRESWLVKMNCLPDATKLVFCGSSSLRRGLVYSVGLWYFLVILTCLLRHIESTSVVMGDTRAYPECHPLLLVSVRKSETKFAPQMGKCTRFRYLSHLRKCLL